MKLPTSMSALWRASGEITQEIEHWLRLRDSVTLRLHFKASDQVALLRLRVWSTRYYLSVFEILDMVMPVLRHVSRRPRKQLKGLGVNVRTLTGQAAERILTQELPKIYPNGENRVAWKTKQQEMQLAAEAVHDADGLVSRQAPSCSSLLTAGSVQAFVSSYRLQVVGKRVAYREAVDQKWRRRRRYRGNPWL